MPRAYRHLTWRVVDPDSTQTSSLDSELQSLARLGRKQNLHWVTVARGNGCDLAAVAEALNRARFTLNDIRPARKRP